MNEKIWIRLIGGGFAFQTAPFAVHGHDERRANEYLDEATSLNTSHFTEYVLPYLVALIAGAELLGIGAIDQLTNLF